MLRFLGRLVVGVLAAIGVFAICAVIWLVSGGMSARRVPGAAETWIAVKMRSVAVAADERARKDPEPPGPDALKRGMQQFADDCAGCHANDGSGQTEIGRGLYPRPPDLRRDATQSMSDGEIFHIVDQGIRFTGMPALDHEDKDVWALVHFVRHLPDLTKAEMGQMKALNPKGAAGMTSRRP